MNKKTMNKLKLSLITIATLTTANVNAQTFYQCVREACPSGQYFDGVNCKSLPTQTGKSCIFLNNIEQPDTEYYYDKFFYISSNGQRYNKFAGMSFSRDIYYILLSDGEYIGYKYAPFHIYFSGDPFRFPAVPGVMKNLLVKKCDNGILKDDTITIDATKVLIRK